MRRSTENTWQGYFGRALQQSALSVALDWKLCSELIQFATTIPKREKKTLLEAVSSVFKGNVLREIELWLIIKSKSSLDVVVVSEQKLNACSYVSCQVLLFIVYVYTFSYCIR